MKTIVLVLTIVGMVNVFSACGNNTSESRNAPTQMGTDTDSSETPYMDTTGAKSDTGTLN